MEDVNIEVDFIPTRTGSASGTLTVRNGEQVLFVDTVNIARDKARSNFVNKVLGKYTGLDKETLEEKLMQTAAKQLKQQQDNYTSDIHLENQPLHQSKKALEETDAKLIKLAEEFLQRPDLVTQIINHANLLGVAGEKELVLTLYLIGTSRLLPHPLAGLVMGASSAGKSYVVSQTARLFPDEAVLQAHRMTPRSLEHMPPGSLVHRFVVAGERSRLQDDAAAEATRALREMISDGKLSLIITEKNLCGKWETIRIEQEGPIAYVESTTLGIREIFPEDRTRLILMSSNEHKEQTTAIISQLATAVSKPQNPDQPDSIIALHHTAQRLLQPWNVVIPFAENLITSLPHDRIEVRRTFGHLLSFIQAVALLHQYQRDRNEQGQIIATLTDYDIVRLYLPSPLARSLGCELTPGAKDLLETAKRYETFTTTDMVRKTKLSEGTVRGRIKELVEAGQIEKRQEHTGSRAAVFAVVADAPPLHGLTLPKLVESDEKKMVYMVAESVADKT